MSSRRKDEHVERRWTWEPEGVAAGAGERLLYEPGNWGDLLKGLWATAVVDHLLQPPAPFFYLDPYAGAPSYPLTQAASHRLRSVSSNRLRDLLRSHVEAGRWPSTATLVRQLCKARGVTSHVLLFDSDPERRLAWQDLGEGDIEVSAAASGEVLLSPPELISWRSGNPSLVLVDPYDLFDHWGTWLKRIESIALETPVLAYLYDKSARSAGHRDQYRRLQTRLEQIRGLGLGICLGRIASDAVAPRAHHVVALFAEPILVRQLQPTLRAETESLATDQGCDTEYSPFEA